MVGSNEARFRLFCSELWLARRIKFLKRRPSWSLRGYIVIMGTWCTSRVPKGFFRVLFYPFGSSYILEWRRPQHDSAKRMQGLRAPLNRDIFLVFFSVSCFSVHYWLFHMLCYGALCLSLMYQNTVTVFVMYIVSRIKGNEMWGPGT